MLSICFLVGLSNIFNCHLIHFSLSKKMSVLQLKRYLGMCLLLKNLQYSNIADLVFIFLAGLSNIFNYFSLSDNIQGI